MHPPGYYLNLIGQSKKSGQGLWLTKLFSHCLIRYFKGIRMEREATAGNSKRSLTAGIIIVGDEILKGHVQDTNSFYLCKQLWQLGVKVSKISVVSDDLQSIADEVRLYSSQYDFVFTTGGIGPTHDDVTLEAVGKAFDEEIVPHAGIIKFFNVDETDIPTTTVNKIALVPKSTKIYINPKDTAHEFSDLLITVHNVHIYAGVPFLMKDCFQKHKELYANNGTQFYLKELFFSCDENILAIPLAAVQGEFPAVQIGSYPNVSHSSNHLVKVTFESSDKVQVEKAYTRLILSLPTSVMMSSKSNYGAVNSPARKSLRWFLDRLVANGDTLVPDSLCQKMFNTVSTLEKCLDDYNFDELCVAFNGGKDCTLILELLHSLLQRRGHNFEESKIKVLYVVEHQSFPEVTQFVEQSVKRYDLEVIRLSGSIQQALEELKSTYPKIKAICMGTRYTDPYSGDLQSFTPTDSSWPDYMRVNSILDWTYTDVWVFLRLFGVPYCKLYELGYTSLDGMEDTHKNPALLVDSKTQNGDISAGDDQTKSYLPAYMLSDEGLERAGRNSKIKTMA